MSFSGLDSMVTSCILAVISLKTPSPVIELLVSLSGASSRAQGIGFTFFPSFSLTSVCLLAGTGWTIYKPLKCQAHLGRAEGCADVLLTILSWDSDRYGVVSRAVSILSLEAEAVEETHSTSRPFQILKIGSTTPNERRSHAFS